MKATHQNDIEQLKEDGKDAAEKISINPLTEGLMRLGFAARGLIYFAMGLAAFDVALSRRGSLVDQQGAIAAIGRQPAGQFLLAVLIVGLAGYALWGVVRAIFDPLRKGSDMNGLVQRAGYLFSAFSYGALILPTWAYISKGAKAAHNGAQTAQTQGLAASILSKPWGPWVVGIVGMGGIAAGLYQVYIGLRPKFDDYFKPYAIDPVHRTWIERVGRFGTAARGVVFALVGLFLFIAAYQHNARQARGIDGALAALLKQPAGPWLLGLVALGLISFGIYSALSAQWFKLKA